MRYFKRIIFVLIVILTIVGVFLYGIKEHWWLYDGTLEHIETESFDMSEIKEIQFEYGKYNDVIAYGKNIVRYNNHLLEWINEDGEIVSKSEFMIQNPIYKANDEYLIVGEKDNTRVLLYKNDELLWKNDIDGKIVNLDVNDDGYVTVVKSYSGYKSACEVYDVDGNKLTMFMRSDSKIINAIVSQKNDLIQFIELETKGASISTNIVAIDIEGNEVYLKKYQNIIYFKLRTLENNKCVAVGSNSLVMLDAMGNELNNVSYNNILGMEKVSNGLIAIAGNPKADIEAEGTIIELYTANGELKARYDMDINIKTIDAYDGAISIVAGKTLVVINSSGKIIGGCELEREIMNTCYLSNKQILISSSDKGLLCRYE